MLSTLLSLALFLPMRALLVRPSAKALPLLSLSAHGRSCLPYPRRAQPLARAATAAADTGLPEIDISAYVSPSGDAEADARARARVAREWDNAMRTWGFARVVGHSVPREATEGVRAGALAFFDRPLAEKLALSSGSYGPEGYTAMGVEAVGRTSPDSPDAAGQPEEAPPDLVENIVIKRDPPADSSGLAQRPHFPPELLPHARAYWASMEATLEVLHRIAADALGVPLGVFAAAYRDTTSNALRLAHYPAQAAPPQGEERALRYSAHTDYQGFTLLMQDPEVPGLQVFRAAEASGAVGADGEGAASAAGAWVSVPPGGLIVNAGDLIALWANGRWRSAMHRVSNDAIARRRLSLVFFTGPRDDALIEPILAGAGDSARHGPVRAGEHLRAKLAKSNT